MEKLNKKDSSFVKNPHNNFILKVFSDRTIAKGYFKEYLPSFLVKQLDFRTLKMANVSFIDEKLKPHYSDLIFICRWKKKENIYLPILLEHQSRKPNFPHLKLFKYLLNGYEYQIGEGKKQKGDLHLNVIIPMFLYHGKAKWEFRPFEKFFNIPDKNLIQFIPNFVYLLNNLTTTTDEELKSKKLGYLIATLLLLKHYQDKNYIIEKTAEIFDFAWRYSEIEDSIEVYIRRAIVYIASGVKVNKDDVQQIVNSVSEKLKDPIMTAYDQIKLEGKAEVIENLINEFPDWSNQKIAKIGGLSVDIVRKKRKELKK